MPRLRHCRFVTCLTLAVASFTLVSIALVHSRQKLDTRVEEHLRVVPSRKSDDEVIRERRKLNLQIVRSEGEEALSPVEGGKEAPIGEDGAEGDRKHVQRLEFGRMKLEERMQLPQWRFPLVCVICSQVASDSTLVHGKGERQHQQVITLLKTVALFSFTTCRIILMTDTFPTFEKIQSEILTWPFKLRRNLHLEHRTLTLPRHQGLATEWRPCVWAKHFLPDMLKDLEAAIYLDTDTIFLGPPTDLWWLLDVVWENPTAVMALGPEGMYQREDVERPFAGKEGVNTGVMAMDLNRMRNIPTRSTFLRHDQDAVNFFLRQRPELFVEVTSRWNFSPSSCLDMPSKCPDCMEKGIVILHGADASFYRSVDLKFNALYGTLALADPNVNLAELVSDLMGQLLYLDKHEHVFLCSNASSLNQAIQRGLQSATNVVLV
ncbi:glucoside xylosyltransferase 2-like [Oratosquilla oratoria]|uniref:glucoside xylosyltransferase 2-like n=1 Tax=Oratosquilla oratoria TaxID=337810 RepID=UPI003F76D624